uniref:DUF433 domain-containing protein n=1 Tax=Desulfonatronospira sp. TaxID=1962951 RepID=UPI0025C6B443
NPDVLRGKPVIKGTRISVELIVRKLGEGSTIEDILEGYPNLSKKAIQAAVLYAADIVGNEPWFELNTGFEQGNDAEVTG